MITVRANHYQQFDADFTRDVPAEGFGGWRSSEIELDPRRTAVVVMHAWDTGTREQYPGWHRCVDYFPRADAILRDVFPSLLAAVRTSPMKLFHVVSDAGYAARFPGHLRAKALAGPPPAAPEQVAVDPALQRLREFRSRHVMVGARNASDVERGVAKLDFPPQARPLGDEGVAEDAHQLFALCRNAGINHLVYAGFAINWCLLLSPGGMADMKKHGVMCSALRQAVTAVENKESACGELGKENALWRVALGFGFVFDVDAFIAGLSRAS
ncbi:MAG: hypothetical protein H0W83_17705 [Planctomycetes bacterium]|nr:hypothetical protein [Planctomycetota bacterium]